MNVRGVPVAPRVRRRPVPLEADAPLEAARLQQPDREAMVDLARADGTPKEPTLPADAVVDVNVPDPRLQEIERVPELRMGDEEGMHHIPDHPGRRMIDLIEQVRQDGGISPAVVSLDADARALILGEERELPHGTGNRLRGRRGRHPGVEESAEDTYDGRPQRAGELDGLAG